jgi:hypothetical protein
MHRLLKNYAYYLRSIIKKLKCYKQKQLINKSINIINSFLFIENLKYPISINNKNNNNKTMTSTTTILH